MLENNFTLEQQIEVMEIEISGCKSVIHFSNISIYEAAARAAEAKGLLETLEEELKQLQAEKESILKLPLSKCVATKCTSPSRLENIEIPSEIAEAALKVELWFAEQNIRKWKFGGLQERE